MLKHEFYKIFINGKTVLFVLALIVLNVIQLVYAESSNCEWSVAAYNKAWDDAGEVYGSGKNHIQGQG